MWPADGIRAVIAATACWGEFWECVCVRSCLHMCLVFPEMWQRDTSLCDLCFWGRGHPLSQFSRKIPGFSLLSDAAENRERHPIHTSPSQREAIWDCHEYCCRIFSNCYLYCRIRNKLQTARKHWWFEQETPTWLMTFWTGWTICFWAGFSDPSEDGEASKSD